MRCEPGAASAVARALEAEELEGLTGTIAAVSTGTFGLGFQTLPVVFAQMGAIGPVVGAVWFFMLFLAAVTSSVSMYQPALAFLRESLGLDRVRGTLYIVAICLVGSLLVIYYTEGSVFCFGSRSFFSTCQSRGSVTV